VTSGALVAIPGLLTLLKVLVATILGVPFHTTLDHLVDLASLERALEVVEIGLDQADQASLVKVPLVETLGVEALANLARDRLVETLGVEIQESQARVPVEVRAKKIHGLETGWRKPTTGVIPGLALQRLAKHGQRSHLQRGRKAVQLKIQGVFLCHWLPVQQLSCSYRLCVTASRFQKALSSMFCLVLYLHSIQ
jgi:hypothetical protein